MVVHLFGQPVDMDPVLKISKKYNLKIIEDCAEAHGVEYKGKKVGSIGDIGAFSFFANKTITCGEGGMVVTNSKEFVTTMPPSPQVIVLFAKKLKAPISPMEPTFFPLYSTPWASAQSSIIFKLYFFEIFKTGSMSTGCPKR
jgi:hypothetical protein